MIAIVFCQVFAAFCHMLRHVATFCHSLQLVGQMWQNSVANIWHAHWHANINIFQLDQETLELLRRRLEQALLDHPERSFLINLLCEYM